MRNAANQNTIHLNGQAGDIILQNADCAEDFELLDGVDAAPGHVMVIGEHGKLRPSQTPYDRHVAGIIAGAGDLRPGIILGRKADGRQGIPIALMGRTYCKVDATETPIEVGDLLTTSGKPGFAMKATDPLKAFGAIIGKALEPLKRGTGMILVLVALQ